MNREIYLQVSYYKNKTPTAVATAAAAATAAATTTTLKPLLMGRSLSILN